MSILQHMEKLILIYVKIRKIIEIFWYSNGWIENEEIILNGTKVLKNVLNEISVVQCKRCLMSLKISLISKFMSHKNALFAGRFQKQLEVTCCNLKPNCGFEDAICHFKVTWCGFKSKHVTPDWKTHFDLSKISLDFLLWNLCFMFNSLTNALDGERNTWWGWDGRF